MKFAQLLVLICLAGGVLGCGQKGPLVMPDAQKHKRSIPAAPGAPAKPASGSGAPPSAGRRLGDEPCPARARTRPSAEHSSAPRTPPHP